MSTATAASVRNLAALSVHQPYASQIAGGVKWLEIRSWATRHRGPLLICAAARPKLRDLEHGVALAVVDVVDCRRMTRADRAGAVHPYIPGMYVWELANARRIINPFPVRGQQRLFRVNLPDELDALI